MLIEVLDVAKDSSFVIRLSDAIAPEFKKVLPFKSRAMVWKEEVYFETPLSIDGGELVYRVERGKVYFWKPGRALCVFYGVSQIYTPGIEVGFLVDPPNRVAVIEEGDELEVREHGLASELKDVAVRLEEMGFEVATPLDQGSRVVVARKVFGGVPISVTIYVEDYGVHVESEALAKYGGGLESVKEFNKLKKLVESVSRYSRLDVSEDGYVVITACSEKREDVATLVEDVSRGLWIAKKHLVY